MNWYKNEKVLSFIGGAAAVIIGGKILKMPRTRELCVKSLASGITAKNNISAAIQNIREDAEDLCADAIKEAAMAEDAMEDEQGETGEGRKGADE